MRCVPYHLLAALLGVLFLLPCVYAQKSSDSSQPTFTPPTYTIVDLGVWNEANTTYKQLQQQGATRKAKLLAQIKSPQMLIGGPEFANEPSLYPVYLSDINDKGVAVGNVFYSVGGNDIEAQNAVLWKDGKGIMLKGLGGTREWAGGINNKEQIVGSAGGGSGIEEHACLWQDRQPYDLNQLLPPRAQWKLLSAFGIDDKGQILVLGYVKPGKIHVLRLVPKSTKPSSSVPGKSKRITKNPPTNH